MIITLREGDGCGAADTDDDRRSGCTEPSMSPRG
jgi:hypothetical protein